MNLQPFALLVAIAAPISVATYFELAHAQTTPTAIVSDYVANSVGITHCGLWIGGSPFEAGADLANLYPVDVDPVLSEVRCYFDFSIFPPGQHELTATFARCVDNGGITTCAQGDMSVPFVFNGLPAAPGGIPSGWGFE